MGTCELCGNDVLNLIKVKVAGTEMKVCNSCKFMGRQLNVESKGPNSHSFYRKKKENIDLIVVDNATSLINSILAKKGLNIKQLARMSNIRESTLNKYLSSKIPLDLMTAKKLENFFDIVLTKEVEGGSVNSQDYMQEEGEVVKSSLGDLLMQKLKEKNK